MATMLIIITMMITLAVMMLVMMMMVTMMMTMMTLAAREERKENIGPLATIRSQDEIQKLMLMYMLMSATRQLQT